MSTLRSTLLVTLSPSRSGRRQALGARPPEWGLDQTAAQEPTYANHAQCPWAGACLELISSKTSDGFPKNSGGDAGVAWGRVSPPWAPEIKFTFPWDETLKRQQGGAQREPADHTPRSDTPVSQPAWAQPGWWGRPALGRPCFPRRPPAVGRARRRPGDSGQRIPTRGMMLLPMKATRIVLGHEVKRVTRHRHKS